MGTDKNIRLHIVTDIKAVDRLTTLYYKHVFIMTSLQGLLPPPGSSNWRKSRSYTDSDEDSIVVRHVVIREVWVEKRPWPHAVYKIDVLSQTSHWFVFKRYKEFYQLHQRLIKKYGIPKNLLPPRKLTNNMARENLESRREALEHYLQKLL